MPSRRLLWGFWVWIAAFAGAAGPAQSQATRCTWTGRGNDDNWSTAANWNCDMGKPIPPSAPDTLIFFGPSADRTPNQDIANFVTNLLNFDVDAGNYTLRGKQVSLAASQTFLPAIDNANTVANSNTTIMLPIEFPVGSLVAGSGTAGLTLAGALSGAGGLEIRSSFTLTFSGDVKTANSYGGTTTLNSGNLVLNKSTDGVTAVPGNLVIGDGSADVTVTIRAHSEQIADTSDVTINNRGTLKLDASGPQLTEKIGTLSGSGIVDLGVFSSFPAPHNTLMTDGKDGAVFSGKITGSGNLVKYGDHNLVLTGKSDYTGTTTIQGGILTIDGSIGTKNTPTESFRVVAGTLKGTGTISTVKGEAKNFTVGPGGTIHPGKSPGILTINSGGFEMEAGSVFEEEIGGRQVGEGTGHYSRLNVADGVTLNNSTLTMMVDATLSMGDLFGIIDNMDPKEDPVEGMFEGLPDLQIFTIPSGYTFEITYFGNIVAGDQVSFTNGNDVVLMVVGTPALPEPSSLAVLATGVAVLWGFLRAVKAARVRCLFLRELPNIRMSVAHVRHKPQRFLKGEAGGGCIDGHQGAGAASPDDRLYLSAPLGRN